MGAAQGSAELNGVTHLGTAVPGQPNMTRSLADQTIVLWTIVRSVAQSRKAPGKGLSAFLKGGKSGRA